MAIYTRVYSQSSARQLVSGKGTGGGPLSGADLLEEFQKHADKWNPEPTALVSVSSRIIDTIKRALEKYYRNGESPADIWVAFIEFPADDTHESPGRVHSAYELARKCGHSNPEYFRYETVVEWAIPEHNVLHQVSLHTLMDRGLLTSNKAYLSQAIDESEPFSTKLLRRCVAEAIQRNSYYTFDLGFFLASFAKKFGARAPLRWTARQLFLDCVQLGMHGMDSARLYHVRRREDSSLLNIELSLEVEDAIGTVLYDWWLADIDFVQSYREYEDWEDVMEQIIVDGQVGFWETWHYNDHNGTARTLSEEERLAYETEHDDLLARHERIRARIEAEAVRIGL